MNPSILVTGGTGTIGSRVVPLLRDAGREVRVLSRHPRAVEPGVQQVAANTVTGAGLDAAFEGIETVLHLAGGAKGDDVAARNLVTAARTAGVRHIILISVVGADQMPIGYFRMKRASEREIENSGISWTILRVAQLHDFALPIVKMLAKMSMAPRGLRFESVGVDEVAASLAALTLGDPAGRVADLAGPTTLEIADMIRAYNTTRGKRRSLLPIRIPGVVGRAYRAGGNLAAEPVSRGRQSWADFLAVHNSSSSASLRG